MPFDAARKRSQKLFVRTVDTYIMVLAIAYMKRLSVQELWIVFWERKFDVWQLIRSAKHYGQQNQGRFRGFINSQDAILCWHLQETAKKPAWTVWRIYLKITESFNEMSVNTDTIDAENDAVTKIFSVLFYERTSKLGNITEGNIRA